jgi:hypothetical protein
MYFLKCSNCGHLNEVKTEYLTFCKNCNKVLNNNFPDWVKKNPDKSFEDFKQSICTTEVIETPKSKSKSIKIKGLKYWIGFAITFAIFYAVGQLGGEKIVEFFKKPGYNKAMMETASEINKSCPIMIDNATRLDNAVALPGNIFQYNYTLVNLIKDSVNINELKNYLEPTIINYVKSNPEMKAMRENKTTINYYYKDNTGIYLFTISIKPEQYK